MMIAGLKLGVGISAAVLACGLLAGCAPQTDSTPHVTITGSATTTSTPDVDAGVKGDLANIKTAVNAYVASKNGKFPTSANLGDLKQYGGTVGAGTHDLKYTQGTGANALKFCLTATGESGQSYVVTSSTAIARGDSCPSGAW